MNAKKTHESSTISSEVPLATISSLAVTKVAGEGGQHSQSQIAQPSTVPTRPTVVTHASHELVSVVEASIGSIMLLVVSSAMVSSTMVSEVMGVDGFGGLSSQNQSSTLPVKLVGVNLTSQVATEGGDVDFVGSEGSATTTNDFDLEGVHLPGPTIRELVGDLDKSWGNSKDWML